MFWIKVYADEKALLHRAECSDSPGSKSRGAQAEGFKVNWPTWLGPYQTIDDARTTMTHLAVTKRQEFCSRCPKNHA